MNLVIRNRALLILAVFLTALAVVVVTHQRRELVAGVQDVRQQGEQLQFENDKLRLERGFWGQHSRIEKVARNDFKMRPPREDEVVLLDLSVDEQNQAVIGSLQ